MVISLSHSTTDKENRNFLLSTFLGVPKSLLTSIFVDKSINLGIAGLIFMFMIS